MSPVLKDSMAVAASGIWINASEFFRNEVLVKSLWTEHYQSLGMPFPSAPVNGMMWGVWGFLLAAIILMVLRRASLGYTVIIVWLSAFALMWIVIWNMGVMPAGLLWYALPLSLLEVVVAVWIVRRLSPQ